MKVYMHQVDIHHFYIPVYVDTFIVCTSVHVGNLKYAVLLVK